MQICGRVDLMNRAQHCLARQISDTLTDVLPLILPQLLWYIIERQDPVQILPAPPLSGRHGSFTSVTEQPHAFGLQMSRSGLKIQRVILSKYTPQINKFTC
jgi:hypothetical protein